MRTVLYRHYDVNDALLYVGVSLDALQRLMQHRYNSEWYHEVRRVELEWHACRQHALEAERQAIEVEGPLWNIQGNNRNRADSRYGFAVLEAETGMFDGIYWNHLEAQGVVEFWDDVRPDLTHRVVTANRIPNLQDESLRLQNVRVPA